jgi:uncharacterized protein
MRFTTLLFLVLLSPTLAWGGPIEDGIAAYDRHDYPTALKILQPLADQGSAEAQYIVGSYYSFKSPHMNPEKVIEWHMKAAEQGHSEAQYSLGMRYEMGYGVKRNSVEAEKWYRKSAEQGNAGAQQSLAMLYEYGEGIKKDSVEAAKWWRRAAEQGNSGGQRSLGIMYRDGWGVPQNWMEAYFWLSLASAQSEFKTRIHRDKAASHLTQKQIAAVKKRVAEWKPTPENAPAPPAADNP